MRLAQGQLESARALSEQAIQLASQLDLNFEKGISQRVLGQVLWASEQHESALVAFEQSLALLSPLDPYETARTQAQWGQCLMAQGDDARGALLVQAARETFTRLGAQWDLAQL